MIHYERIRSDLRRVERMIIVALRFSIDSEMEKRALEESPNLVQETAEKCRLVQAEFIQKTFPQGVSME